MTSLGKMQSGIVYQRIISSVSLQAGLSLCSLFQSLTLSLCSLVNQQSVDNTPVYWPFLLVIHHCWWPLRGSLLAGLPLCHDVSLGLWRFKRSLRPKRFAKELSSKFDESAFSSSDGEVGENIKITVFIYFIYKLLFSPLKTEGSLPHSALLHFFFTKPS